MYKILVHGRGISSDTHRPFGDFENPLDQHAVPSGIFKIPSGRGLAMGIWGKSTTINQNFVHIFFLILSDIKTFPLYILLLCIFIWTSILY